MNILTGSVEFSLRDLILDYCNYLAALDPVDEYALWYYEGVKVKVIDHKKV